MLKSIALAFAACVSAGTLALACSSSSASVPVQHEVDAGVKASKDSGRPDGTSCGVSGGTLSTACVSCLQSSCASESSSATSMCSDYVSCLGACSTCSESCAEACEKTIESNKPCLNAEDALSACQNKSCMTTCPPAKVATLPPDAGKGKAGKVVCNVTKQQECTITGFSAAESGEEPELEKACTGRTGVVVKSCPTVNLVGCCTLAATAASSDEDCYYSGTAADLKATCVAQKGKWATTQ